ncbi:MAG: hypothetical protein AAF999_18300 [Pseudomonadota bacterium]
MKKLTLDTNCILEIDEDRPQSDAVKAIIEAHNEGLVEAALVASSGSEKSHKGLFPESFDEFDLRRTQLGFSNMNLLFPIAYHDIGFCDHCLMADVKMLDLEEEIFRILFPNAQFTWVETAKTYGIEKTNQSSKAYIKWRNQLLDAQMFWAHVWNKRDVFVTSDKNFGRKLKKSRFGAEQVKTPSEFVYLLRQKKPIE